MESIFEDGKLNQKDNLLISEETQEDIKNIVEHTPYFQGALKELEENRIQKLRLNKIYLTNPDSTINRYELGIFESILLGQDYMLDSPVKCMVALSDSHIIVGRSDGKLHVWDIAKQVRVKSFKAHKSFVGNVCVLTSGKVVSVSYEGEIKLWDPINWVCLKTIWEKDNPYRFTIVALQGDLIMSSSSEGILKIRSPYNGVYMRFFKGHNRSVSCMEVLPSGLVITGSYDKTLKLWDPLKGILLKALNLDGVAVCFSTLPNGNVAMAIAIYESGKSYLAIWNPLGTDTIQILTEGKYISCVTALSNRQVAYASNYDTFNIWDLERGISFDVLYVSRGNHPYFVIREHYSVIECIIRVPNGSVLIGSVDGSLKLWDPSPTIPLPSIKQSEVLYAVSKNQSLNVLDLSGIDLGSVPNAFYYLQATIDSHPTLMNLKFDLTNLTVEQLKNLLISIFQNVNIRNFWLSNIALKKDGKLLSTNWPSTTFEQQLLKDLKAEGYAAFAKGYFAKALACKEVLQAIDPTYVWDCQYKPTVKPFNPCIDYYYTHTYFVYHAKRNERNTLTLAIQNEQKPLLEQLCACLDAIFNLKFLEASASANKNSFGELILPMQPDGQETFLIGNLLARWLTFTNTDIEEQLKLAKHLSSLYLKSWYQETWTTEGGFFVIGNREQNRVLSLLEAVEPHLSGLALYKDFLLLLLKISAGVAKDHKKSGITVHHLSSESDPTLNNLMTCALNQIKMRFGSDATAFDNFLFDLEKEAHAQFYALRQKQLGRSYTGSYHSQLLVRKPKKNSYSLRSIVANQLKPSISSFEIIKVPNIFVSDVKKFCLVHNLSDQAELALTVFHETLFDLLNSRKIMGGLANSKLMEIKEKGNWAKIKELGWVILKAAPMVGTAMKYTHIGCQIVGQAFDVLVDEAQWIETLTGYLEYIKTGAEMAPTGIKVLEYWDNFKKLSEGLDAYMRKLIDGSDLDTEASFKQFATVFKADAGKDALERFVYSLLDRYRRQIQLLKIEGAQSLANAINVHLEYLFSLNFDRWKIAKWGEQRRLDMLAVMRHWVSHVSFFKDEWVILQSGKQVLAQSLLQHCGLFFKVDEELLEVDVILDQDETAHLYLMSDSGQYGYRKAEPELVEEFKDALQLFKSGHNLLSLLQTQFSGKKTKEELDMLKELGNVLGIRFSPRLLAACQAAQSVGASSEVVWESPNELIKEHGEQLDKMAQMLSGIVKSGYANPQPAMSDSKILGTGNVPEGLITLTLSAFNTLKAEISEAKNTAEAAQSNAVHMQWELKKANEKIGILEEILILLMMGPDAEQMARIQVLLKRLQELKVEDTRNMNVTNSKNALPENPAADVAENPNAHIPGGNFYHPPVFQNVKTVPFTTAMNSSNSESNEKLGPKPNLKKW